MDQEKVIREIPEEPIIASIEKDKLKRNKNKFSLNTKNSTSNNSLLTIILAIALIGSVTYIVYFSFIKAKPTCPLCQDCSLVAPTPTPTPLPDITDQKPIVGIYTHQIAKIEENTFIDYSLSVDESAFMYMIITTVNGEIIDTILYVGSYEEKDKVLTATAIAKTQNNEEVEMSHPEMFSFTIEDDYKILRHYNPATGDEQIFTKR